MRTTQMNFVIFFSFFFLVSPILTIPLAPAMYVFGDSLLDSGNNNFLLTLAKANYFPYGADFPRGATGRFTDGRTVADFIAEYVGLPYSPPYVSCKGLALLTGINYASGSCGIMPETGRQLGRCLTFGEQINIFGRTVKKEMAKLVRSPTQLSNHLSKSLFIISIGSNDYINNYLQPEFYDSSRRYQPKAFGDLLIGNFSQQLKTLYEFGARKVVVFEMGPIGCIPGISRTHQHTGECMEEANQMASYYNEKLSALLKNLTSTLPGSTFVHGQCYSMVVDTYKNPSIHGLTDARNPCCITWLNGTSTCVPFLGPCIDRWKHVFWDAYHLTEAVYSVIASGCIKSNASSCTPMSIEELVKI